MLVLGWDYTEARKSGRTDYSWLVTEGISSINEVREGEIKQDRMIVYLTIN
jgi:hypothetical protein